MVLNENNKDIYINYCMRLCMIGIKDNGIKIENISQLKGYVTEEISYALYNKKSMEVLILYLFYLETY